jgi:hypothetical protein
MEPRYQRNDVPQRFENPRGNDTPQRRTKQPDFTIFYIILCVAVFVSVASLVVSIISLTTRTSSSETSSGTNAIHQSTKSVTHKKHMTMPSSMRQVDTGVYHLGTVYSKKRDGKKLDGYLHMLMDPHFHQMPEKHERVSLPESGGSPQNGDSPRNLGDSPKSLNKNGKKHSKTSRSTHHKDDMNTTISALGGTCWGTLGAKVATLYPEMDYGVDTENNDGLSHSFITKSIQSAMHTWDCRTTAKLFGQYNSGMVIDGLDLDEPDGKNEILFIGLPWSGTIAVTVTWIDWNAGLILEYDIAFNDDDYDFGDGKTTISFLGTCTHELGHCLGANDQYSPQCSDATMNGYASVGEGNKKATLDDPDIEFLNALYPEPSPDKCTTKSSSNSGHTLHISPHTMHMCLVMWYLLKTSLAW